MNETIELYEKLVKWIASHAPQNWYRFEINMEIDADKERLSNSWVMKSFDISEKKLEIDISGRYKLEMRDIFIEIYDLQETLDAKWSVCDFVVLANGKYDANYSYGKPPRLSGDLTAGT